MFHRRRKRVNTLALALGVSIIGFCVEAYSLSDARSGRELVGIKVEQKGPLPLGQALVGYAAELVIRVPEKLGDSAIHVRVESTTEKLPNLCLKPDPETKLCQTDILLHPEGKPIAVRLSMVGIAASEKPDDTWIIFSTANKTLRRLGVTVSRLEVKSSPRVGLANDLPSNEPIHIVTRPPLINQVLPVKVVRHPWQRKARPVTPFNSQRSIRFLQNGTLAEAPNTDAQGQAELTLVAGPGGQGLVTIEFPGNAPLETFLWNPIRTCCGPCPEYFDNICIDIEDAGKKRSLVGSLGSSSTDAVLSVAPQPSDGQAILPTPRRSAPDTSSAIDPHSGEYIFSATDLQIPGRGLDYFFTRTYRSQSEHLRDIGLDDFGVDWAFSYSDRLIADGPNVVLISSSLRSDVFTAGSRPGTYESPQEFYETLRRLPNGQFRLRSNHGNISTFASLQHPTIPGRLLRLEDPNGNALTFHYEGLGGSTKHVLRTVVDSLGRNIRYKHYPETDPQIGRRGRLKSVQDFIGRTIVFDYDTEGNLTSVTSPVVQATPHGNDFPVGKTTHYAYLTSVDIPTLVTGHARRRLLHNLVKVVAPNETAPTLDPNNPQTRAGASQVPRNTISYGMDDQDPINFDRVRTYSVGGVNASQTPAGGTLQYRYATINLHAVKLNEVALKTTVIDRRGNRTEYVTSLGGTILRKDEFTRGFRAQEPMFYRHEMTYNDDKRVTRVTSPEGGIAEILYDTSHSLRSAHGNAVVRRKTPDGRGAAQSAISTARAFEPIYQLLAFANDPRGLDPSYTPSLPDACSHRSAAKRFTTTRLFDYQEAPPSQALPRLAQVLGETHAKVANLLDQAGIKLGLGDINGDGIVTDRAAGNVLAVRRPAVSLASTSQQAAQQGSTCQIVEEHFRYSDFGQLISRVDAEGNVHVYEYYPEIDPDGDGSITPTPVDGRFLKPNAGGYLSEEVLDTIRAPSRNNGTDSNPVLISTKYQYDPIGNVTATVDGRGIRTAYTVNSLNQVVQIIRADAVPSISGPLPLQAYKYITQVYYDFNNNVVRVEVEDRADTSNTGGFVDYRFEYDILDNLVTRTSQIDVQTKIMHRYRYDPNEHVTLSLFPEGNADAFAFDERDLIFRIIRGATQATAETLGSPPGPYNPRGGIASTITRNYDRNGNLVEQVDGHDTDGSPLNGSAIAGAGDAWTYDFDGFDRHWRTVDPLGNRTVLHYDPQSLVVRKQVFGRVGGPSPTDATGSANVELADTIYRYDELDRLIRRDRRLFVAQDVTLARPPRLTDGTLTPGDQFVTQRYEYDRKSRRTFITDDSGHIYRFDYDGADRWVQVTDPLGNVMRRAYDNNGNEIERLKINIASISGVSSDRMITTYFYDALDRIALVVDNVGRTTEYRYDSRDNLVAETDAAGFPSGVQIQRRAFSPSSLTVNTINKPGNVTLHFYDGINRRVRTEEILTSNGKGNGAYGVDGDGAMIGGLAPDTSQAGDGIIVRIYEWDENSLLLAAENDLETRTEYIYDNLNRPVRRTQGVCTAGAVDRCDSPRSITVKWDADDNVRRTIDEAGTERHDVFDATNRLIDRRIVRAPGVVGTTHEAYEYDGLSRLTKATDDNNPSSPNDDSGLVFKWDSLSRLIEENQTFGAVPSKVVSSGWVVESNRVAITYPNGREIEQQFDVLGRVFAVADAGGGSLLAIYAYLGPDRLLERRYPINQTKLTLLDDAGNTIIGYDGVGQIKVYRHVRYNNALIVGVSYIYDRRGNPTAVDKLHMSNRDEVYQHDSASRLTAFSRGTIGASGSIASPTPSGLQSISWVLDGVGNKKQATVTSNGVSHTETGLHDATNALYEWQQGSQSWQSSYDPRGNLTEQRGPITPFDQPRALEWDYRNRLIFVRSADGTEVNYRYDALGRRVWRRTYKSSSASPKVTAFLYDGWKLVEERNAQDAVTTQYVYGRAIDELIVIDHNRNGNTSATDNSDQRLFVHQDALASTLALTNTAGRVVEGYDYDPYGSITLFHAGPNSVVEFGGDDTVSSFGTSAFNNAYTYMGRRFDGETKLFYFRYRYFDPIRGRFLSRDPIGVYGAGSLYAFAGGQPVSRRDPFGLQDTPGLGQTRERPGKPNPRCKWVIAKIGKWDEISNQTYFEPLPETQVYTPERLTQEEYHRNRTELEANLGGSRGLRRGRFRFSGSGKVRQDGGSREARAEMMEVTVELAHVHVFEGFLKVRSIKQAEECLFSFNRFSPCPQMVPTPEAIDSWYPTGRERTFVQYWEGITDLGDEWVTKDSSGALRYPPVPARFKPPPGWKEGDPVQDPITTHLWSGPR